MHMMEKRRIVKSGLASYTVALPKDWIIKNKSVILRVPSTIIREEFNYLINPAHPDFKKLSFGNPERFTFDPGIE